MPFMSNTMGAQRSNVNARPPQRNISPLMGHQQQMDAVPSEFIFEYNFDEQGILYYLGSMGRRRLWQNPHSIGQVQAFASSIG